MGLFDRIFGKKKPRIPIGKIVQDILSAESPTLQAAPEPTFNRRTKIDLCNRAGCKLGPKTPAGEVDATFAQVQQRPDFSALVAMQEAEEAAEIAAEEEREEREERERLGDAFLEKEREWQALSTDGHYLAIFRRGKSIVVDVVELSYVDRNEEKTPFIEIGLVLARRPKRANSDDYVEWDKDISVKAQNILHFQHLPDDAFPEDVERYDIFIERGKAFAARFEQQG